MLKLEKYDVGPTVQRSPVSDPQISPDGGKILFVRSFDYPEEERMESHIWITPTGGSTSRQLSYGDGNDSSPRWSPDGGSVYFTSNRRKSGEEAVKKNRL